MNNDNPFLPSIPTNFALTVIPYTILIISILIGWPYSMDDAFIYYTYGRNLAETGIISYNGIVVEGYCSFLPVLISSLCLLVSSPDMLLPMIKVFSLLTGLLMVYLVGRIISEFDVSTLGIFLAKTSIASSPIIAFHCASGLETPLIYVCSLGVLLLLVKHRKESFGLIIHRLCVFVFLGMLIRPDFALAVIPLGICVFGRFQIRRIFREVLWWPIIMVCLIGTAYLLWRYFFFGDIFPNPYYVKKTIAVARQSVFIDKWKELSLLVPAVPIVGVLLMGTLRSAPLFSIAALSTATYTLAFYNTNFWQDHYLRYFSPLIPLAITGCYAITASRLNGRTKYFVLLLVSILTLCANAAVFPNYVLYTSGMKPNSRIAIGKALSKTFPPETLTCTGDAGAIPFFSRLPNLDIYFLNSSVLMKNRIANTYWGLNTDLVYSLSPDVLILTSVLPDGFQLGHGGNRGLSYQMSIHPDFSQYVKICAVDASSEFTPFKIKRMLKNYHRNKKHSYVYQVLFRKEHADRGFIFMKHLREYLTDKRCDIWTFKSNLSST